MKYIFIFLYVLSIIKVLGQVPVHYLSKEPKIDGFADEVLPNFKLYELNKVFKSSDDNQNIKTFYYLAYNEKYFYLYIETEADSITIRDRGYQNGDGFHILIGKPQKDNSPTDEFYVLAFSPEKSWCHKIIWYYNIDLKMKKLSNDTKFETGIRKKKTSFELLIPWKDIYPYHPWFTESIGFNLCFVKAIGDKEKNYYFLKEDDKIQSEQSKKEYVILNFETPKKNTTIFSSSLQKNHIFEKENLFVKVAGYSNKAILKNFTVMILSGENSIVKHKNIDIQLKEGFSIYEIPIESEDIISGGYRVKVLCENELLGEHYLSVFSKFNSQEYLKFISSLNLNLSEGTYNTLMFYTNEIDSSLYKLKNYEFSFDIRYKIAQMDNYLKELKFGNDLISKKKGIFRRAYFSEKDNKLHPYSIYIPDTYSGEKKYPLLVYLHGSGDDDRVLSKTYLPDGFIILAPNGRGTSNCFVGIESQNDIEKSILDVIKNYNIDTNKIILSGFSMGGYGVYRTFYEHPERYKALAVISGHPDLARKWIDSKELNFLEDRNLKKFTKIPIYIYHSTNDMNCPFDITNELVKKLRNKGCNVIFEIDKGGHGNMGKDFQIKYYNWLIKQIE